MEKPKKGIVKKNVVRVSVPVELKALEDVEGKESDDSEEQLRVGDLMCDAVDLIVQSRSAAIVAIRDGHMASLTAQLQLMVSTFPEHIRKMPMKEFLKQHCPNTIANTRSDGTVYFNLVQDPNDMLQTPGVNFNTGCA